MQQGQTSSIRSRLPALARLSVPRARRTPAASSAGTGGRPTPSARLLRGQTTTAHPARRQERASRRRPPARSARPPAPGAARRARPGRRPGSAAAARRPRARARAAPGRRPTRRRPSARNADSAADSARWMAAGPPLRTRARSSGAETECGACAARRICTSAGQVVRDLAGPRLGELQHGLGLRRVPGRAARRRRRPPRDRSGPSIEVGKAVRHVADRDRARSLERAAMPSAVARLHRLRRRLAARGHERLHPGHEAAGLVQPAREMGQLEMAVRVHEAGQEHAGPQVAQSSAGRRGVARRPTQTTRPSATATTPSRSGGPLTGTTQPAVNRCTLNASAPSNGAPARPRGPAGHASGSREPRAPGSRTVARPRPRRIPSVAGKTG